ncbi:MAG: hypothetical protein LW852_12390, partial [Sediminibacterium sp.]|nr:hypothetical protein [Sediminibacterium sp.]
LASAGATDLFVISHGWRNDAGDAMSLYRDLFTNVSVAMAAGGGVSRRAVVAGVFWPSKPRYKDWGALTREGAQGAVAYGLSVAPREIERKLEQFKEMFETDAAAYAKIDEAKALATRLKDSPNARDQFVELLRGLVSQAATAPEEDSSDELLRTKGRDLLAKLQPPTLQPPKSAPWAGGATSMSLAGGGQAGSQGAAAGWGPSDIGAAALKFVDLLSYYEMKERAGTVGGGLSVALQAVRAAEAGLRIHLIGHSFGARLVTSAAKGPGTFQATSMVLLQAAFSHNAFSANYKDGKAGYFRSVVAENRISGPIAITHTINDDAVGVAYPWASRLANQQAARVGGPVDVYGALGRNGAIKTSEADSLAMGPSGHKYAFRAGRIHNLLADSYIQDRGGEDAHGDVRNTAVANVVLATAGF